MSSFVGETLISREAIVGRIAEMGKQISADYAGSNLTVVGILKGSFVFVADLVRALDPALTVEVDFMAVSSYGKDVSPRPARIVKDLDQPIADKNILIAEDIVDSGATLQCVYDLIAARGPRSLRVAALLDKAEARRAYKRPLDYVGFRLTGLPFAVGYGLDHAERHRNLPGIHVLEGVSQG